MSITAEGFANIVSCCFWSSAFSSSFMLLKCWWFSGRNISKMQRVKNLTVLEQRQTRMELSKPCAPKEGWTLFPESFASQLYYQFFAARGRSFCLWISWKSCRKPLQHLLPRSYFTYTVSILEQQKPFECFTCFVAERRMCAFLNRR